MRRTIKCNLSFIGAKGERYRNSNEYYDKRTNERRKKKLNVCNYAFEAKQLVSHARALLFRFFQFPYVSNSAIAAMNNDNE